MPISWDSLAPVYDWQLCLERQAVRMAVDLAAVADDDRVLDVGTGTGAILRELQRRDVRPATVLGIDRSDAMLRRVPPLPAGWRLQRARAWRLPLPDASIDVAFAAYILHLLGERERLASLQELRRVLTRQGRLVLLIPALPANALGRRAYQAVLRALEPCAENVAKTLRPIAVEAQLTQAGFGIDDDVRVARGYPARCLLAAPIG